MLWNVSKVSKLFSFVQKNTNNSSMHYLDLQFSSVGCTFANRAHRAPVYSCIFMFYGFCIRILLVVVVRLEHNKEQHLSKYARNNRPKKSFSYSAIVLHSILMGSLFVSPCLSLSLCFQVNNAFSHVVQYNP